MLLFVVLYRMVFALFPNGAAMANIKNPPAGMADLLPGKGETKGFFRSARDIRVFDRCQEMGAGYRVLCPLPVNQFRIFDRT